MKFHRYLLFITLCTSLLLTSCNSQSGLFYQPTETPAVTPSFTPTKSPTPTFTPTNTPTPTITPTPIPLTWKLTLPNRYTGGIDQTSEGNFIITSFDLDRSTLTLLGPKGVILWEKTLVSELYCFIKVIQQTADEGFILAGHAFAPENDAQICLIKTDKEGNPNWEIPLGRTSSYAMNITGENRTSVQQTQDGGFIVAGETYPPNAGYPDILLAKIDLNGQVVWEQTFGDYQKDYVYSVQQTPDGGYILAGYTWLSGAGRSETRVIKTDSTGNMLWEKTFGGTSSNSANFLQKTDDGGFIFTGRVYPPNSYDSNVWLVKLDSEGNTVWEQTYGEEATSDGGKTVQQTTDGGYIILGETESYGAGSFDMWLIKTDAAGNIIWDKTFGDENQNMGITMQQTIDGGYILHGYTITPDDNLSSNLFHDLIKTDPDGNIVGMD